MLEDAKQLAELKVENDDVLALTYQLSGTHRAVTQWYILFVAELWLL